MQGATKVWSRANRPQPGDAGCATFVRDQSFNSDPARASSEVMAWLAVLRISCWTSAWFAPTSAEMSFLLPVVISQFVLGVPQGLRSVFSARSMSMTGTTGETIRLDIKISISGLSWGIALFALITLQQCCSSPACTWSPVRPAPMS